MSIIFQERHKLKKLASAVTPDNPLLYKPQILNYTNNNPVHKNIKIVSFHFVENRRSFLKLRRQSNEES